MKNPAHRGVPAYWLADQGSLRVTQGELLAPLGQLRIMKNPAHRGVLSYWLADQGSNLDSSEPKSDVLPVTPSAINIPLREPLSLGSREPLRTKAGQN